MNQWVKPCKIIETRETSGNSNGWIQEIVSEKDGWTEHLVGQVYVTVCKPQMSKGFHEHLLCVSHLTCIVGKVKIIAYMAHERTEFVTGEDEPCTIKIPANCPFKIVNISDKDAYVINYRYPAYDPNIKETVDWEEP